MAKQVSNERLEELSGELDNRNSEMGPLDREDLREALRELIVLRQLPAEKAIGETAELLEVAS